MNDVQFYSYKDGSKCEICKNCLTMHVNNFEPDTYLWILEKMDVPYVPAEWQAILDKAYAKDPKKVNGTSVLGKYLSKMKLKQWNPYHWADTETLQEESAKKQAIQEEEQKRYEATLKKQLEAGEISEAQYRTLASTETQMKESIAAAPLSGSVGLDQANPFAQTIFMSSEEVEDPLVAELTAEDKKMLALKWGRLYQPSEWIELEKTYKEMSDSFDIQDADTINTLILICKTNLKANQALDQGDLDGFQKLSRVLENLRKSAKFTAAQNKEEKADFVDCVGELISLCERDGFIPRYATDIPQDKVDLTLKDMNEYLKKLVTQDLGFGQQIEDAIKKIQIQQEMAATANEEEQTGVRAELADNDFEEYYDAIEEQQLHDDLIQNGDDE